MEVRQQEHTGSKVQFYSDANEFQEMELSTDKRDPFKFADDHCEKRNNTSSDYQN